jgi:hypothetical protein
MSVAAANRSPLSFTPFSLFAAEGVVKRVLHAGITTVA